MMDEEIMKDDPVFQNARIWADAINNMNPKIARAIIRKQKKERKTEEAIQEKPSRSMA